MRRANSTNLNTPKGWDGIYSGVRTLEIQPMPAVREILRVFTKQAHTALDIGCGLGRYFDYMGYPNTKIYGVDIAPETVAKCATTYPLAEVTTADINKGLLYDSNKFDVVYAGEVLEHVEDPVYIVSEIYRVVAKGGRVVLNTPFSDFIPAPEHLWYLEAADLADMFKPFKWHSIMRCENGGFWEHLVVFAEK